MIAGKKITLGSTTFEIPPVPFSAMRKHKDVFEGKQTPDITVMADIVYAALLRNYPDLDQAKFENDLDITNVTMAFNAAMAISGAEPATGEAKPG